MYIYIYSLLQYSQDRVQYYVYLGAIAVGLAGPLDAGHRSLLRGRAAPVWRGAAGALGDLHAHHLEVIQDAVPRHILIYNSYWNIYTYI